MSKSERFRVGELQVRYAFRKRVGFGVFGLNTQNEGQRVEMLQRPAVDDVDGSSPCFALPSTVREGSTALHRAARTTTASGARVGRWG